MRILPVCFILTLILSGCGASSDQNKKAGEMIQLTESQVSNFIFALPVIIDFSEQYQSALTEEEKNSPDFQDKYNAALRDSVKIKNACQAYGFSNVDELLTVYQNVAPVYHDLLTEFSNYNQGLKLLNERLGEYQSNYDELKTKKNLSPEEKEKLDNLRITIDNNYKRYSNIIIVNKYKKAIDAIATNTSSN